MPSDDLSDLERRLASWRPDPDGLNPDTMLFAAGRASARPWLAWCAAAACLAGLAFAAAGWRAERAERLALAEQLRQRSPAPSVTPPNESAPDEPGPNSYFTTHRALEHGLDAWPPRPIPSTTAPALEGPVLDVGDRGALLDF